MIKSNQDSMRGTITLLTTTVIPKISLLHRSRHCTQPQLKFFPPVQFTVALELSHRGDEDCLADPCL